MQRIVVGRGRREALARPGGRRLPHRPGRRGGAAALAEARSYLEERGVQAVYVEGVGSPADVIVQEAEESGADLIVVGTRGLNAAKRLLLGSVSINVVQHAPCDVLVAR